MERYTYYQIGGLGAFVLVSAVAFALISAFPEGYVFGLVLGFIIGLTVALFQYGVVVETEAESRGYPGTVARKIDKVFEG
jgi:hypothetical protein